MHDEPGSAQRNEHDEGADRGLDADLQRFRNVLCDTLAQPGEAEDQEQHAGERDHAERRLPRHAHLLHQHISEDDVGAHGWRYRERKIGAQPHHDAAEDRRERRGADEIGTIHSCIRHDRRVHRNDISHRREGGRAGHYLTGDAGAALGQAEEAVNRIRSSRI